MMISIFTKLIGKPMQRAARKSLMWNLATQYRANGARRIININDPSSWQRFTLPAVFPKHNVNTPTDSRRTGAAVWLAGAAGAASSSAGTWTHSVSTLVRSLLATVPPQGLAPDYDVLAISDEDCSIVAVEFRRWIEQRLAHQHASAAPSEGQMPPPPPPPPPPRPGGRLPTARELELDDWTAYVAEGEAAADDEKDYLGILDSACSRTCHGDAWGNRFRAVLDGLGIEYVVVPVSIVVRGIGGRVHCDKAYRWPCGIFGRPGEIMSIEIPDSPTPLLLSR